MKVLWVIFLLGFFHFKVGIADSCEKEIHYLDKFTIRDEAQDTSRSCSSACRRSIICTHWSSQFNKCELKYIPSETPHELPYDTKSGFVSGERFCGSLVPSICPNQTPGDLYGGKEDKISTKITFDECISKCGQKHKGKIYITRTKDADNGEMKKCWCEFDDNDELKPLTNYKTCTLPARDAPKSISIDGKDTLVVGEEASFECNFNWVKDTSQYTVPSITFTIANISELITTNTINKIDIETVPKMKQLKFSCIVNNKGQKKSKIKTVNVQWNKIKQISGNVFPEQGTNQTYTCHVDANPTQIVMWNITDMDGTALDIKSQIRRNEITLNLKTNYPSIVLTCHSTIEENRALDMKTQITIVIGNGNNLTVESPGLIIGIISILILALAIIGFLFIRERKSNSQRSHRYKKSIERNNATRDNLPTHMILNKDHDLGKNIKAYVKSKTEVNAEFEALELFVSKEIKESFAQAKAENNAGHNRYVDILPFDSNVVKISKPTGDPETTYFNASVIKFPTMKKSFIAAQAPKPNSFSNFWQMIIDKKVSTIVMITGLNEGGKVKSHQYWPDMDNTTMKLDNNITINYESHSFPGTYYHRKLKVKDVNGKEREVNHIQTTAWLDMTAPKKSKILLDLVYQAQELAHINPDDPILVHCSAGVGRTGTFIAVYKLTADYHNEEVNELDVFSTVVEMRKQRVKMVQKPQQYSYVIKCLKHYVMAQESVYSNIT